MDKHHLIGIFVCGIFSLATTNVEAYVYGYTRLYRSDTHTTVDLVYDRHTPADMLTHSAMHVELCDEIKQGLHPTEKVLVESLEHLNQVHPGDTTVIWEHAGPQFAPAEVHLLTYPERLVIRRLRNLEFISSDVWRHEYPVRIMSLLQGGSIDYHVDRNAIIENSGFDVWQNYQAYIKSIQNLLVSTYRPYHELIAQSKHSDSLYKDLFFAKQPYCKLADLEMLSHLLASSHHHIVLFAGGAHSTSIASFLLENAPYELVHSVIDPHHREIDPSELECIALDHRQNPRKTARPSGSAMGRRVPVRNRSRKEKVRVFRQRKEPLEKVFSDDECRQLFIGGALALGGMVVAAYYEHKETPDRAISALVKQKISTAFKYGSIPAALAYLYVKSSRASRSNTSQELRKNA